MSLRFRLNLMIALTMLVIVGVGALFVVHNARRSVSEEVRASVDLALQLVDIGLAGTREEKQSLPDWLGELARLKEIRHLRISLWQPGQTQKHRELGDTRAPAWFTWAVTPNIRAAEKRFTSPEGMPIHILVEADPSDEIAEAWVEARGFILLMLALAVVVSVLVHVTLGRAFKSVGLILQGLEDIEQGDYSKRLPAFMLPEFDRISATFNHMAKTLSKSRDENRALARQSLKVQEDERRYLAQELHDELGQSLSAIKAMSATLRPAAGASKDDRPEADVPSLIMEQCDRLFGVLRAMMRRLRPLMLDELGLIASLEDMIENWRNSHPEIDIRFIHGDVDSLVDGAKIHLFRIVQECLTNVAKHSLARHVFIELQATDDGKIRLYVTDDGRGFDAAKPNPGFGLRGIFERVASLDGSWELKTSPGNGVKLEIHIPCEAGQFEKE